MFAELRIKMLKSFNKVYMVSLNSLAYRFALTYEAILLSQEAHTNRQSVKSLL